jgi:2-hydroxychromene-2-carboxylate isomerase
MGGASEITLYIDYKSPYAYLAKDPAYNLERDFGVNLTWLPYTLDIPSYLGSVDERNEQQWRKVRYAYMDARRHANQRDLTLWGPRQIYDTTIANIGMLYAQAAGVFRAYNDIVFERFWRRELEDIEDVIAVRAVLAEAGAQADGFEAYLENEGRADHDRIMAEAHEIGVFGVPTFVLDGELFWGNDRVDLVRQRLAAA